MELDKRLLDQLVDLMKRDGLDRLRVRVGDLDIDLRMTPRSVTVTPAAPSGGAAQAPLAEAKTEKTASVPANVRKVLAPLVGVFYRAPAPGAPPFVSLGDTVSEGQVLCILEAMKLMNEIVSEHDGKIVKLCVEDGELVSLHQELFWIQR